MERGPGAAAASACAAVVLLGGRSARQGGRPKALLRLGGGTVLDRVLAALSPLGLPVHLVLPHPDSGAAAGENGICLDRCAQRLGLPVARDLRPDAGPLGGLEAALAATGARRLLLLACDLPFLTSPFLSWLLEQADAHPAVVPTDGDRLHPLCAVYAAACCRAQLEADLAAGRLRFQDFALRIRARQLPRQEWASFDPKGRLLANLNQPADYEAARRWVVEEEAGDPA